MASAIETGDAGWLEHVPSRDVERLAELLKSAPRSVEDHVRMMIAAGPEPIDADDARQRVAHLVDYVGRARERASFAPLYEDS